MNRILVLCLSCLFLVLACDQEKGGGDQTNSQTHWLSACESDADCGDAGLACICEVCTVTCELPTDCTGIKEDATCAPSDGQRASDLCTSQAPASVGICLDPCQNGQCEDPVSANNSNNAQPDPEPDPDEARQCGGLRPDGEVATCRADEYCHYVLEDICGWADATGMCRPLPAACDADLDPVCGCNGQTYSNECVANADGTSISERGECQPTPQVCGGRGNPECPDGQFCRFDFAAICGTADATGLCRDSPSGCDDVFAPVCGCDNQTYPNECEANAAGFSAAYEGECQ